MYERLTVDEWSFWWLNICIRRRREREVKTVKTYRRHGHLYGFREAYYPSGQLRYKFHCRDGKWHVHHYRDGVMVKREEVK